MGIEKGTKLMDTPKDILHQMKARNNWRKIHSLLLGLLLRCYGYIIHDNRRNCNV